MRRSILAILLLPLSGCASIPSPLRARRHRELGSTRSWRTTGRRSRSICPRAPRGKDSRSRRGGARPHADARAAATATTNYRLASVTKQFTAMAILILSREGKLTLADPIETWLGELPVGRGRHDPPSADPHLRDRRLRGPHREGRDEAGARPRRPRSSRRPERIVFRARIGVPLQQQRLRPSRR